MSDALPEEFLSSTVCTVALIADPVFCEMALNLRGSLGKVKKM